ncbi:hypothetical protein QYF36_001491 [Acer negundo]|nr:hypothetical protein QYF36_001491 [Acer negundo]
MDFDEHFTLAQEQQFILDNRQVSPNLTVDKIKWNILDRFSFDSSHKLQKSSIPHPIHHHHSSVQVQGEFDIID